MSISVRLRQGIELLGIKNLKEVASRCGLPYRSLQNYLSGERDPNADALAAISSRLGISADWLLTGSGAALRSDEALATGPPAHTLASRLKAEREANGYSLHDLAVAVWGDDASDALQQLLEEGRKAPTDGYLLTIATKGLDVGYVMTGERSKPIGPTFEDRVEALRQCTRSRAQRSRMTLLGPLSTGSWQGRCSIQQAP